jgi:replicative DNA helicase
MIPEPSFQPVSDANPPQNIEAEEAILGAILLDPEAIGRVADALKYEAFYISAHREVYRAALALQAQGKPTDLTTISAWLQDNGKLDGIGGQSRLAQLIDRVISTANVDQYAELVMDKYLRRLLIKAGNEVIHLGYDTTTPLEQVLDQSEQKVFGITNDRPQGIGLTPTSDILTSTFNEIESRSMGTALAGIPCNFYDLDALTQGFQRSDLIIVAARPAMGKTSFVLNIARNIAVLHKLPVCIFSLEMSKEQLVYRLLSSEVSIESGRLRTGRIRQEEWEVLGHAISSLSQLPIYIDDTPDLTVSDMRSKLRRLQAEHGGQLGLVLIDYLQLMEGSSDNRVQELSKMTRALKGMARELQVPVMTLSQLSRGVESRPNKRPMMSDLRESGCITGETLITLADSGRQVPIRELVGQSNISVWALNESTMKLERSIVSHAFSTGVKPVFKMDTALGRSIRATANHQFLTIRGWKRLDQLQVGDRIALPRQLLSSTEQTLDDAKLALLGHLIGDGCTLPRHAIQYTTREIDLAETVSSLATRVFGSQITPRIVPERTWYQVYLAASERLTHGVRNPVAAWMDELEVFGLRSHEKFVPPQIFEQPQSAIALFLRHLWSTDGCIKLIKGRTIVPIAYYASSSQRLATDVQSLLLRLGINARHKVIPQIGKGRDQHHVIVTGKLDLEKFVTQVGAVGAYKRASLQEIDTHLKKTAANTNRDVIEGFVWKQYAVPSMQAAGLTTRQMQAQLGMSYCGTGIYQQNISRDRALRLASVVKSPDLLTIATSDIYWDQIKSIEPDGMDDVYDLTVPTLHNFVANNIVVHNSIEQDADLVMMIYRDEYYNPDSADRGIAEIIITKHRNGPVGTIKLLFESQFTRFRNLASS